MEALIDSFGEAQVLFGLALCIGMVFGAAAQHSQFCLRAATVEITERSFGPRLSIWLVAFCAAIFAVQGAIGFGYLDASSARQIAGHASLSGALIGGVLFGSGMILTRGCASRLLVLSATGNLRAVITGLVFVLVATTTLGGVLSPLRGYINGLWSMPGGDAQNLLTYIGLNSKSLALVAGLLLLLSLWFSRKRQNSLGKIIAALLVGGAVAAGWLGTYTVAQTSFEVVPIASISFTSPSIDTLMGLTTQQQPALGFGVGLVSGVFIGALVMAVVSKEFKIQRFDTKTPMERYLLGGAMMGFGSVLAGGCSVGAGLSGGAIFALTAWIALVTMWIGAIITHLGLLFFKAT